MIFVGTPPDPSSSVCCCKAIDIDNSDINRQGHRCRRGNSEHQRPRRILGKLPSLAFLSTSAMGLAGPPIRGRRSAVSLAMLVDEDRLGSKESCVARSDEINPFILLFHCPSSLFNEDRSTVGREWIEHAVSVDCFVVLSLRRSPVPSSLPVALLVTIHLPLQQNKEDVQ
ncbi:hypothetical protein C8J56DRAFT_1066767 [Mycena floridula]|nr:hypothetical protein C8J56DRAFT_1066767 [Mycena floridula]